MTCDIRLIRQQFTSYNSENRTYQVDHQVFWEVGSWQIGELFAEHYLITNQWQPVCSAKFAEYCQSLIKDGKDDCQEYPKGALRAVVKYLEELDEGIRYKSNWFVTLDY